MADLKDRTAIVTGASQGIGKAIAFALQENGVDVLMIGRSVSRMRQAAAEFSVTGDATVQFAEADLSNHDDLSIFADALANRFETLDILVNCGGSYERGRWGEASRESLSSLLATNVEGPYILTSALIPALIRACGDVIFVNSSITRSAAVETGQFAATQHALKALADSLRAEYNAEGIRVTSIFPGRTATPRQEGVYEAEGRVYRPERLLQPEDVAECVVFSLRLPATAEVTDFYIRPRYKT